MIPSPPIIWREPWWPVTDPDEWQRLQDELQKELSHKHPLWDTDAKVFGKHQGCDDVLVTLKNGNYANVHLVWHGKVDQQADKFPDTVIYDDVVSLQKALDLESDFWA